MNYKRKLILILAGAILAFIFAVAVLCQSIPSGNCYGKWGEAGQAVGSLSIALMIAAIPLFFLREEAFRSWFSFAKFYLPIVLALILWSAFASSSTSWGVSMGSDAETFTWFFSILFLIISIVLIIWKSWRLRRTPARK